MFKKANTAVQKQIDNLPPSVSAFLDLKTSEFRAISFNCFGYIHTHIISVTRLTALRLWHIPLQCCLCYIGAGYVLLALLQLYGKLANTVKFCTLSCLIVTDFTCLSPSLLSSYLLCLLASVQSSTLPLIKLSTLCQKQALTM